MKEEILLNSNYDYENLVAEIYIDEKYIASVSYDKNNIFFVETPNNRLNEDVIAHKIDYDTFIKLLRKAKERLVPPATTV